MNKRTIEMVMHNPPVLPRTFEEDIKKELCNNYAFADKNGFTVPLARNITSDRQKDLLTTTTTPKLNLSQNGNTEM